MVAVGVAVLLGLGGVGVAVNLYDEATAIDRGEPDQAVSTYLEAFFTQRNDVRAASLECTGDVGLEPIRAYRAEVDRLQQGFAIQIGVSWGPIGVESSGSDRQVTMLLTRTARAQRVTQTWQFDVVDEGGWKVCGAQRIG